MIERDVKIILTVVFVIVGSVLFSFGFQEIYNPLSEQFKFEEHFGDFSYEPEVKTLQYWKGPSNFGEAPFRSLFFEMKTFDSFSEGNPYNYTVTIWPEPSLNYEEVAVYFAPTTENLSHLDDDNIKPFIERRKIAQVFTVLEKNDNGYYSHSNKHDPNFAEEMGIFVFLKIDGEYWYEKEIKKAFTIKPATDKILIDLTRASVAQLEQSIETTKAQEKNNNIIAGLTFFILGWIPFQTAIMIWFRR